MCFVKRELVCGSFSDPGEEMSTKSISCGWQYWTKTRDCLPKSASGHGHIIPKASFGSLKSFKAPQEVEARRWLILFSKSWLQSPFIGNTKAPIGVFVEKPLVHQNDEDSGNRSLVEPILLGEGKGSAGAILSDVLQKNDGFVDRSRFLFFLHSQFLWRTELRLPFLKRR